MTLLKALITGGARRIGKTLVEHLACQGWHVILHYNHSREKALDLQGALKTKGFLCDVIQGDLTDDSARENIISHLQATYGEIDLLINNASLFEYDKPGEISDHSWQRHMDIHMKAPLRLMEFFAKNRQRKGLVINIIDSCVLHPPKSFTSYTASKIGLWGLTQTMALELAPLVRVNAIGPGPTLQSIHQSAEMFHLSCRRTPLQTGTRLEDICHTVDYFWKAESVTGQLICVDGGKHLGNSPDPHL